MLGFWGTAEYLPVCYDGNIVEGWESAGKSGRFGFFRGGVKLLYAWLSGLEVSQ
jgi:hypothetical protein